MTSEQAAKLIQQNDELIQLYQTIQPLLVSFQHDLFPFFAVAVSLLLGIVLGRSCT